MWRGLQNLQVPTTEVKTNFGEREAFACPDGVFTECAPRRADGPDIRRMPLWSLARRLKVVGHY